MKEIMENVFSAWKLYWGEGFYQYLVLAALLYLLVFCRKKEGAKRLLGYTGVFLAAFFFPATAWVMEKCVGELVYWRVLWLLPVVPLLAYAGTDLIGRLGKKKSARFLLTAAVLFLLAFCGKSLWQAGNYVKVHNFQKVPDEAAQICDLINSQKGDEEVYLAADDYLAAYVRVYDPSIRMPYSRAIKGSANRLIRQLYQEVNSPDPNFHRISQIMKKTGCNYLVCKIPDNRNERYMKKKGFSLIGTVNSYGVYRYDKK